MQHRFYAKGTNPFFLRNSLVFLCGKKLFYTNYPKRKEKKRKDEVLLYNKYQCIRSSAQTR